jgi:hypothetical protein
MNSYFLIFAIGYHFCFSSTAVLYITAIWLELSCITFTASGAL